MNKKIKLIDVLVIGSGLSSLVFLHSYLKKRKGVDEPTFSDQDSFFKRLKHKFFFRFF